MNVYISCRCGAKEIPRQETGLRYMVSMFLADCTGGAWATMFEADSLFGQTAQQLEELQKADPAGLDRLVAAQQFTPALFSVKARVDSFNNSAQFRLTVLAVQPVGWGGSSGLATRLLAEITRLER